MKIPPRGINKRRDNMKLILVLMTMAFSSVSLAHGSKIELVEQATVVALEKFETEEPEADVDAFNAVKSWVSGNKIKVKVYFNANANRVTYSCEMKHEGEAEEMVCVKQ